MNRIMTKYSNSQGWEVLSKQYTPECFCDISFYSKHVMLVKYETRPVRRWNTEIFNKFENQPKVIAL